MSRSKETRILKFDTLPRILLTINHFDTLPDNLIQLTINKYIKKKEGEEDKGKKKFCRSLFQSGFSSPAGQLQQQTPGAGEDGELEDDKWMWAPKVIAEMLVWPVGVRSSFRASCLREDMFLGLFIPYPDGKREFWGIFVL